MSSSAHSGSASLPGQPSPPRNRILLPAVVGILVLLAFLLAGWYLTSAAFQQRVRSRVVAELQRSTGGRVELGAFRWNLSELQFEARNLTIHGREGAGELPFFHADRVLVRMRIASVFSQRVALSSMQIEHPVVHLLAYPDGTTNQPQPSTAPPSLESDVQQLFRLSVHRLDVRDGVLVLNDRSIPLDFTADDVTAGMDYALRPRRYDGRMRMGKLDTRLKDMRPFASQAELEFTLWPTWAQLKSLNWSSGKSHLQLSGHMDNFSRPALTLAYQGTIDLAEVGAVLRRKELRSGMAAVQGNAGYQLGNYLAGGRVEAANVELSAPSGSVRHASMAGEYSLSNDRVTFTGVSGRALGGKLNGNLEIVYRVEPTLRAPHHMLPPAPREQQGVANLRLEGVSVAELTQSFSTRSLPVKNLGLTGSASGSMRAAWVGSPGTADVQMAFTVVRPSRAQPGQLPLNAQIQATYSGARHTLTFSQLNAVTAASSLRASGTMGSSAANLKVDVETSNLRELQPVLAALQGPRHIPVVVHGKAAFNGSVAGRISGPTFAGHLELRDFDTLVPARVREGSAEVPRQMHWDLLRTDLQLSPDDLVTRHGLLRRGGAELQFDGSLGLKRYQATPASALSGQARLEGGELGDIMLLAGYGYPLSGQLSARLQVGGTWQGPRGEGEMQVTQPAYGSARFDRLTAQLLFSGSQAQLENVKLTHGPGQIAGSATYDFRSTAVRFNLQGGNFDLAKFSPLQSSRLTVAGRMDFSLQGSGPLRAPAIDGTINLRQLTLDGEREGDFAITANTRGGSTRLVGRSQFAHADLDLDGDLKLQGDVPAQLTLRFSRLDVDPVLQAYFKGQLTGHSSSAGSITVSGPLLRPRDLQIRGNVAEFRADIENLKIQNSGPLQFAVAQRTLTLQHFHMVGDGTDFEATGTAQLAAPRVLNLRANGTINLKIVQTLNPDYMSSGLMTVALRFGGTMAAPDVRGRVQISNGSLSYIDVPSGLSNINGTLVFNQDRLRVQTLTAQTGGGLLNLGGFITYNRALNFDLTAQGKDIRLRYPPGMSTTANVNLRLVGALSRSTLSGDILVTRFQLARNFDLASYLARAKANTALPNPESPLNNLRLDVHVTTTPELDVQTAIARVAGDADLRLRGTAAKPVVLGRVDIARGDVNFSGTKYHLERGDITFSNPVRIEPVLDLEASARVRDYDITLGFHGQMDKLNATYSSEPPLPTADIIALLAMGRTREESALLQQQPDTSYTRTASNAILSEAMNAANNNRLEKIFGVSRVKIDPEAGGAENNPSWTRVTIEQQISNTLTLTYITNVSQAQQQIIQAEYYLTRNISLIALRDQNGVVSFDISIRRRKK
jgi:translocation and assembly module TamB